MLLNISQKSVTSVQGENGVMVKLTFDLYDIKCQYFIFTC